MPAPSAISTLYVDLLGILVSGRQFIPAEVMFFLEQGELLTDLDPNGSKVNGAFLVFQKFIEISVTKLLSRP